MNHPLRQSFMSWQALSSFFDKIGPKTPSDFHFYRLHHKIDYRTYIEKMQKLLQNVTKRLTPLQETPGGYIIFQNQGISRSYQTPEE